MPNSVQERSAASRKRLRRLVIRRLPLSTGRYTDWESRERIEATLAGTFRRRAVGRGRVIRIADRARWKRSSPRTNATLL